TVPRVHRNPPVPRGHRRLPGRLPATVCSVLQPRLGSPDVGDSPGVAPPPETKTRRTGHALPPRPSAHCRGSPMRKYLATGRLVGLSLFLLGATPRSNLLHQGIGAYDAENFKDAVTIFESAETETLDPGLIAFNKAAALYRLTEYADAARHYRRCLEDATGPRRARALYNLGNCLVQQQAKGGRARLRLDTIP